MHCSLVRVFAAFLAGLFGVIICGVPAATEAAAGHPAPTAVADHAVAFTLSIAPSKQYLEDAGGHPFHTKGDAAWSLIAGLTREEAELYLSDRRAWGGNTLLVSLIEYRYSANAPANVYGQDPFTIQGDFATPNEAYFDHADWVLPLRFRT